MGKKHIFSIIGGDLRLVETARCLYESGYEVRVLATAGVPNGALDCETVSECIENTDYIILPLPMLKENDIINTPFYDGIILLKDILEKKPPKALVLGGLVRDDLCEKYIIDYYNREEMQILNSIPTAEGAIEIVVSETPYMLLESKVCVIGYGRVGKILAHRLQALGTDLTVAVRKYSDMAWIRAFGMKCADLEKIGEYIEEFDIIINTVPAKIAGERELEKVKEDCLIIDLASKPGGIDFEAARKLGLKVIWALSLPGKVAPVSSGGFIKDTVINILSERGAI